MPSNVSVIFFSYGAVVGMAVGVGVGVGVAVGLIPPELPVPVLLTTSMESVLDVLFQSPSLSWA